MTAGEDLSLNQQEKDASIQPGGLCSTPPASDWSEPEKWIWQQICEGNIADFNQRYGELDPKTPDGWSETREITPSFLETILTRKPYESVLHRQGVRISGTFIRQPVDLENASLNHQWWLEKSRFEADINLSQLKSTNSISFDKSDFLGNFVFALGRVGGQFSMDGGPVPKYQLAGNEYQKPSQHDWCYVHW